MTEAEFADIASRYPEAFKEIAALIQREGAPVVFDAIDAIVERGGTVAAPTPTLPPTFKRKRGWKYRVYDLGPIIAKPISGFLGSTPIDMPPKETEAALADGRMSASFLRAPRECASSSPETGEYADALRALKGSLRSLGAWLPARVPGA